LKNKDKDNNELDEEVEVEGGAGGELLVVCDSTTTLIMGASTAGMVDGRKLVLATKTGDSTFSRQKR
jgi:hypothetical protein